MNKIAFPIFCVSWNLICSFLSPPSVVVVDNGRNLCLKFSEASLLREAELLKRHGKNCQGSRRGGAAQGELIKALSCCSPLNWHLPAGRHRMHVRPRGTPLHRGLRRHHQGLPE